MHQDDTTIIKTQVPDRASKYMKQDSTEISGDRDYSTTIGENFNIPLSATGRAKKQTNKNSKDIDDLNNTIDHLDLIGIYRTQNPVIVEYAFSSSIHGTFNKIDHMLDHEISFNKLQKIEILHSIFSDNNKIKLEIKN